MVASQDQVADYVMLKVSSALDRFGCKIDRITGHGEPAKIVELRVQA